MLVIDDNKLKLLKMKEKLLEVALGNRQIILDNYKKLVILVDNELYENLINKIENTNYHNLPLEEQLVFFTELRDDYNYLNELQCGYRNVYGRYATDELELSKLSNIRIDEIDKLVNDISGFLINKKNIDKNRLELEKLNLELIQDEKKKDLIQIKFSSLEEDLRNNVLDSEGRILIRDGDIEYASIAKEFESVGLNLKELIDNKEMVKYLIDDTLNNAKNEEEELEASKICYSNMPNGSTLEMYNENLFDNVRVKYKLVLLKIIDLVANSSIEYNELVRKRKEILNLIKERVEYLSKLNIRLAIDPFDRIKLNEQLELIESLGDVNIIISKVKNRIAELVNKNEEMLARNNELSMMFNSGMMIKLIDDGKPLTDAISETPTNINIVNADNLVVKVHDISNEFMYDRVKEKTAGVITRVNEMFKDTPHDSYESDVIDVAVPFETIENNDLFEATNVNKDIFDDSNNVFVESNNTGTKEENVTDTSVVPFETIDNNNVFDSVNENENIFNDQPVKQEEILKESKVNVSNDIFSEVEPFSQVALFSDKSDDIDFASVNDNVSEPINNSLNESNNLVSNAVQEVAEMPDMFWVTQEGTQAVEQVNDNSDNEKVLSFDEQVDALINNDNNKVKKLVA